MRYSEPYDTTLKRLESDDEFQKLLTSASFKAGMPADHVSKSLGLLYSKSSSHHHGITGEIIIDERDWTPSERLALVLLFRYCLVPFQYQDQHGNLIQCPFLT